MRDVPDQLDPAALGCLKGRRHHVERRGELADLVVPCDRHTLAIVAGGDPPGGGREMRDRARQPCREGEAQDHGRAHRDHGGDDERGPHSVLERAPHEAAHHVAHAGHATAHRAVHGAVEDVGGDEAHTGKQDDGPDRDDGEVGEQQAAAQAQ